MGVESPFSDSFVHMSCSTVAADTGMMHAVLPLAESLRTLGVRVAISGPLAANEAAAAWSNPQELQVLRARGFGEGAGFVWQRVKEILRDTKQFYAKPLIHIHGVWTPGNIVACRTCRQLGMPYVVSPHGMLMPAAMRRSTAKKRLALWAAVKHNLETALAVHATSAGEADALRKLTSHATIVSLPWGVKSSPASPTRTRDREKRKAVFLGRLLPHKGIYELVEAWADVRPMDWTLDYVGSDPLGQRPRLLERIRCHNLQDSVRIHPERPHHEIDPLLCDVDLLILPSRSENFGLCVGEALTRGVPVIVSQQTPWTDIVSIECGWIVDESPGALAKAIAAATQKPRSSLLAMGMRGKTWVDATFSWESLAPRYAAELYRF